MVNRYEFHRLTLSALHSSLANNMSCVQDDGSKRTIRGVFRRLKQLGYDVETIWREIGRVVVKTVIAILPELKVGLESEISNVRPGLSCFQVIYNRD